ncbi:MAG: hypothetical protein SGJ09_08835 [Phycisphaerae bacterium]|nr:hypothetical protein [Phycisphaerae bacterium]
MHAFRRPFLVFTSLTLAAALASAGFAQNALDPRPRTDPNGRPRTNRSQGNALDANLQVGSRGLNAATPQIDFNARNLIVTNNVAGGRGFRGSVGYRAASDFRGAASGDSTFGFRAGSAFSSPDFIRSGRFDDRFAVAQGIGVFEYRRESTPAMNDPRAEALRGRIRLDQAGSNLAYARQIENAVEASTFATGVDNERRPVEFTVSAVQGMRTRRVDDAIEHSGLSAFEKARARRDVSEGRLKADDASTRFRSALMEPSGRRVDGQIEPVVHDSKISAEKLNTGSEIGTKSAYDDIVRNIVERYGDRTDVRIDADPRAIEKARKELKKVRSALGGRSLEPDASSSDPLTKPTVGEKPVAAPSDTPEPATIDNTPEARLQREREQRQQIVSEAARALKHGTQVTDLAPGDRARVDELTREGQKCLVGGEFFKAERFFNQALMISAENPLLLAGLAHAQLGAGLYLSSALSLRTLFSDHPEMIDVRYDPKLLPNETRLRLAVETVRSRIGGKDSDGYALTLAYIGHQLADRAIVEEGLKSLVGSMEDDLLRDLLAQLWLGQPSVDVTPQTPADSPTEAPPAK